MSGKLKIEERRGCKIENLRAKRIWSRNKKKVIKDIRIHTIINKIKGYRSIEVNIYPRFFSKTFRLTNTHLIQKNVLYMSLKNLNRVIQIEGSRKNWLSVLFNVKKNNKTNSNKIR